MLITFAPFDFSTYSHVSFRCSALYSLYSFVFALYRLFHIFRFVYWQFCGKVTSITFFYYRFPWFTVSSWILFCRSSFSSVPWSGFTLLWRFCLFIHTSVRTWDFCLLNYTVRVVPWLRIYLLYCSSGPFVTLWFLARKSRPPQGVWCTSILVLSCLFKVSCISTRNYFYSFRIYTFVSF